MPEEQKTKLRLEIAHVLFIDVVGCSKLLIDEPVEAPLLSQHSVTDIARVRER